MTTEEMNFHHSKRSLIWQNSAKILLSMGRGFMPIFASFSHCCTVKVERRNKKNHQSYQIKFINFVHFNVLVFFLHGKMNFRFSCLSVYILLEEQMKFFSNLNTVVPYEKVHVVILIRNIWDGRVKPYFMKILFVN